MQRIWIELIRAKEIGGVKYFSGYRFHCPSHAARAHIANGDARRVDGPHPRAGGSGYPVDHEKYTGDVELEESTDTEDTETTDDTEQADPSEDDDSDSVLTLDQPRQLLTSVGGIGEEKAEEIIDQLDDMDLLGAPLYELLSTDLTDIKGIGPSTAEDLREKIDEQS